LHRHRVEAVRVLPPGSAPAAALRRGRAEFRPAKHSPKLFAKKRIDALIGAVRNEPTVEPPAFLRRAIARLVRAFAPERIVLFGSSTAKTATVNTVW